MPKIIIILRCSGQNSIGAPNGDCFFHIKNFCFNRRTQVSFSKGLLAFTGEKPVPEIHRSRCPPTRLGQRADAQSIREDCDKAEVAVQFDIREREDVRSWLEDHGLNTPDNDCLLRRQLFRSAKFACFY